ncbi:tyrosine-type recombinase/integrase [Pontiellaceae bacterium B12227]|nr:tyrosine-type recombinase/integrase [Pontiellaceae bacterium B12227]
MKKASKKKAKKPEYCTGFLIRTIITKAGKRYQVDLGTKSGKHVRKSFKVREDAREFAREKRKEVERKGIASLKFSDHQKTDAVEALELLKEYGVNLRNAANYYIKHNKKVDKTNDTASLISQYLALQKTRLERGEIRQRSYKEDLWHLKKFQSDHSGRAIDTIESVDIDEWLDKKQFKATSRKNHRLYISIFFNWAVENEKVLINPVKKTRKVKNAIHTPKIYKSSEVAEIMKQAETHHKGLVAYLSIAFFAGIRPTEILRLDWTDIDFEFKVIHVQADHSKTSTARYVHISDNLATWLQKYKQESGSIFSFSLSTLNKWRQDVYKKSKVKSIQDGARHTFATYFLALHGIDATIQELGHTNSKMLFKHYRGLAKNREKEAKKCFDIKPQREKNQSKGKSFAEALDALIF